MAGIAELDAAIAALKADVDALQPPPPAPDLQPQVDAVNAVKTELNAKFPPPPPPPAPGG